MEKEAKVKGANQNALNKANNLADHYYKEQLKINSQYPQSLSQLTGHKHWPENHQFNNSFKYTNFRDDIEAASKHLSMVDEVGFNSDIKRKAMEASTSEDNNVSVEIIIPKARETKLNKSATTNIQTNNSPSHNHMNEYQKDQNHESPLQSNSQKKDPMSVSIIKQRYKNNQINSKLSLHNDESEFHPDYDDSSVEDELFHDKEAVNKTFNDSCVVEKSAREFHLHNDESPAVDELLADKDSANTCNSSGITKNSACIKTTQDHHAVSGTLADMSLYIAMMYYTSLRPPNLVLSLRKKYFSKEFNHIFCTHPQYSIQAAMSNIHRIKK
eukprot:7863384-Ditylum_brightwellii.AAC.1